MRPKRRTVYGQSVSAGHTPCCGEGQGGGEESACRREARVHFFRLFFIPPRETVGRISPVAAAPDALCDELSALLFVMRNCDKCDVLPKERH